MLGSVIKSTTTTTTTIIIIIIIIPKKQKYYKQKYVSNGDCINSIRRQQTTFC
jgi:hypothetical protein